ncbi:acyl-synthetase family member [Lynx pardinus]|uniref:Medium-chain acyl-CoA ligase ACSF2, mitochondrial n=1 Tax=Lynx pardinus TaxID=191816 RepID=A0A485NAT9_LYNPA|nr:acyl-synthetase family member [Lynx pardinus]
METYLRSAGADRTVPLPVGGLSYIQGLTRQRLINKTVGQCLEAIAQRVPDREALVVPQENIRLTFAQLKEEVDKAASGLLSIGLRKGDRLGMWGPNSFAWVLMQLATAQAGIILVSVNPAYQAMELEYALKKVEPAPGGGGWPASQVEPASCLHFQTSEDLRIILPSPLYHCLGSVGGTMVSLMYGATLILPCPTFDGKKALEAISKERGTILYGTPTMFVDILNQPDFSSYDISSMCGGGVGPRVAEPGLT